MMAREILFTIGPLGKLSPVDPHSAEIWADLPRGKVLGATIRQKRNVDHHRKFFALLNVVWPHQELYSTTDQLLDGIKLATGHTRDVMHPETGERFLAPASIAFDKMDQGAFEQFYDRAVDLICRRIIPGVGRADLEREVNEILAGRSAA
jgi:hypothetical protein